jgi:pyruvate formate lyase activating enzyme
MNRCVIGEGERGYCGLVINKKGILHREGGVPSKGIVSAYYDPLPTNCVATAWCPGCSGAGYPKYAYHPKVETNYVNLAVFYGSCSFDCLFCQNWHYRTNAVELTPVMSTKELAARVKDNVSCICFFGGDASPQILHALHTTKLARKLAQEQHRILRICWETSGYYTPPYLDQVVQTALESGGVIKFDLKTFDPTLHIALCGVSNKPTLENFKRIGEHFAPKRKIPPLLTASTLLVPGYVDSQEIQHLCEFIASIDPNIPYNLLAFYPAYVLNDLPTTSKQEAHDALTLAKETGLTRVRIGNIHLLS